LRGEHEEALGFLEFDEYYFCDEVVLGNIVANPRYDGAFGLIRGGSFAMPFSSVEEGAYCWEEPE
jgi:hypothetical protein